MKQYLTTSFNLETNEIVLTEVRNEIDMSYSDYKHLIDELQENQTYAEYGYKKDGADFDYKIMITRVV